MTVHYLPSSEARENPTSDAIARELVFLAGHDPLLLPDDDAFDVAAVELAENGIRRVKLTLAERLLAATRILSSGGSVRTVCVRLGLPADTESKWEKLQRRSVSVISALVILGLAIAATLTAGRSTGHQYRAHHRPSARISREYRPNRDTDDRSKNRAL